MIALRHVGFCPTTAGIRRNSLFPLPREPPSPLPPHLLGHRRAQVGLPVFHSNFPLTIFTLDSVRMSMPLSQLILPGGGVEALLGCKCGLWGDRSVLYETYKEARDIRFSKNHLIHSRKTKEQVYL